MKRLVIDRDHYYYRFKKTNNFDFFIIFTFLTEGIGYGKNSRASEFKNWIIDIECNEYNGNRICMEKEDGIIIIYDQLESELDSGILELTRQQFLKVINNWEKLCKQNPKEIIVTLHNNGEIIFEINNNVIPEAVLSSVGGKYCYIRSNDRHLEQVVYFLEHKFENKELSHSFILSEWVDSKERECCDGWLVVKKRGNNISLLRDSGKADKSSAFVATKEKLRNIYLQFEQVKLLEPKYIIITRVGDDIKVEGAEIEI